MSKSDPDFWRDGDPTGEGAPDSEVSDDYAAKYLRKPRKRAAIIVTEAARITGHGYETPHGWGVTEYISVATSEQLLGDLRDVCDLAEIGLDTMLDAGTIDESDEDEERAGIARVRAALGEDA